MLSSAILVPQKPRGGVLVSELRRRGRETEVRPSDMSVRNRIIWERRQRELYAEFDVELPPDEPEERRHGGRRMDGESNQRDAIAAWLDTHRGQTVRSSELMRATCCGSSQTSKWLKRFTRLGRVRQIRRGLWQVLVTQDRRCAPKDGKVRIQPDTRSNYEADDHS